MKLNIKTIKTFNKYYLNIRNKKEVLLNRNEEEK